MDFPIILYNVAKVQVRKSSIIKSNCFFFYSYLNFNVRIKSGVGILFSVIQNQGQLDIQEGQEFDGNFGYTLYIPEDGTEVVLEVLKIDVSDTYSFRLEYDNIPNETNSHYDDLLVNGFLPVYSDLEKAIPDEFDKSDLIKRLLLDFKQILKHKGTKKSVEKFLNFIGFDQQNLNVSEEYFNRKTNTFSSNPNKETDIKTGNYYVLYDNFTEDSELDSNNNRYTQENMPLRYTIIQNLDSFSQHLLHAIALANIYFTCEEQEITFFGLNYSSNNPNWLTIMSSFNMIFEHDVIYFRNDLHVNLVNWVTSQMAKYIVKNCVKRENVVYKSEVKFYLEDISTRTNSELFFVDAEIPDTSGSSPIGVAIKSILTESGLSLLTESGNEYLLLDDFDISKIFRTFGCILHLKIELNAKYLQFDIFDKNNLFSKISYQKEKVSEKVSKIIVLTKASEYRLSVKCFDEYNNFIQYDYDFTVSTDIQRIDFDLYNSSTLLAEKNSIAMEIDSQINSVLPASVASNSFVVPLSEIPEDVSTYFDVLVGENTQWLTENDRYELPTVNTNYRVDEITESIPLELIDNWLSIISFKHSADWELKLRVYDKNLCDYVVIGYNQINLYSELFDKLVIMLFDVFDRNSDNTIQNTKTPYYFITTTEGGIDLNSKTYDFVLFNSQTNETKSIYTLEQDVNLFTRKLPINYDFPIFSINSEIVSNFTPYISPSITVETIEGTEYNIIKSLFPKLTSEASSFALNLCDVILCKLNDQYVVNQQNVVWKVFNSFTNELLYESTEFSLKYQINEHTCFDISCDFIVDGVTHHIFKKSLISSF